MRFLIRCAFWLSLVLLFMPFGTVGGTSEADPVGPLQALAAARDAVRDVAGICEREPDVCATARTAAHTLAARAREGMRIAREMVAEEDMSAGEAAPGQPVQPAEEVKVTATGSIQPAEQP